MNRYAVRLYSLTDFVIASEQSDCGNLKERIHPQHIAASAIKNSFLMVFSVTAPALLYLLRPCSRRNDMKILVCDGTIPWECHFFLYLLIISTKLTAF